MYDIILFTVINKEVLQLEGNTNDIGENLTSLRKKSNMSQEKLAEELNVSRQAVSNWERNKAQPDLPTLLKICGIFGIGIDEFMRGEKEMLKDANKKAVSKYDVAIGLFYGAGLFLGIGFFFFIGLMWNQPLIWGASFFGGICLFLVTGLLAHGIITIFRKDK